MYSLRSWSCASCLYHSVSKSAEPISPGYYMAELRLLLTSKCDFLINLEPVAMFLYFTALVANLEHSVFCLASRVSREVIPRAFLYET